MKVQFEFSTADLAEVANRTVNRSPLVHRWRLGNAATSAVLAGVAALVVVPGDMINRVAMGLVIALSLFVVTMYLLPRPTLNKRTQAFYRERLGGHGPFTCEVELTSAGVVSRQLGEELLHPWSHVASVAEVPGGVEFVFTPIGSLLVRDRAFPDHQVRADFVSLARSQVPVSEQAEVAPKRMPEQPEQPFATGPTEREYFFAWLLFFVCVSTTGNLASTAIASGAAAILTMPGVAAPYSVYIFLGLSFIATACLSYAFFRFFAKRLVSQVLARITVNAT